MLILCIMIILLLVMYQRLSKEIPILMYHRIDDIPNDRNTVSPTMFEQQLLYLKNHGYTTISLDDLSSHLTMNTPLSPKSLILTFDDGYEDNFIHALPLLKKYNMTGTVCVISNWIGKDNDWENYTNKPHCRTMHEKHLEEWLKQGMSICAHTVNHPFLSQLDNNAIQHELVDCKATLEKQFGIDINFLCYPYGDFDHRVIDIAKQAGYKGALGIFKDTPFWHNNLFALKRVVISSRQPLWEFALKVSSIHMLFIGMRILESRVKQYRGFIKKKMVKSPNHADVTKTDRF